MFAQKSIKVPCEPLEKETAENVDDCVEEYGDEGAHPPLPHSVADAELDHPGPAQFHASPYSLAHNRQAVANTFHSDDDQFSCSIGGKQTLTRVRRTFLSTIAEQEIRRLDAVDLMHLCLCGIAKDFKYEKIKGQATSIAEAFSRIPTHFISRHHQNQAKNSLQAKHSNNYGRTHLLSN